MADTQGKIPTGTTTGAAGGRHPRSARAWSGWLRHAVVLIAPLAIWFSPLPPQAGHALAIAGFLVLAWATEVVEYAVAGLIGCALFAALKIAPTTVAFGGFATETPWFVLGALLLGATAVQSGLASRIALRLIASVGPSYSQLLLAVTLTSLALTFIIPSGAARVAVLGSICLGLMTSIQASEGSNIGKGLFLVATYSSALFDKNVLAGAASLTGRQLIVSFGHVEVSYGLWLVAFLPATLLSLLALWRLVLWLYPAKLERAAIEEIQVQARVKRPWSLMEKKAAGLFTVVLLLWVTDKSHGLSPALVGLFGGLFALTPWAGLLKPDAIKSINVAAFFYVGAALSMALVLSSTGVTGAVAHAVTQLVAPRADQPAFTAGLLFLLACGYHLFLASEVAMLSTSLPSVLVAATHSGQSPLFYGMVWVFAAGGNLFAYQSVPILTGAAFRQFSAADLLKVGSLLTLFDLLLVCLMAGIYWPVLHIT